MAELDEFFNEAIKIAGNLGKARTKRRQKQQDVDNLATFSRLNTADRNSFTAERRQSSDANLGRGQLNLDKARLAVRKELGQGELNVRGRTAGVAESGANLNRASFDRSTRLVNRIFPEDESSSSSSISRSQSFINQADQNVLEGARGLISRGKGNIVENSRRRSQAFRSKNKLKSNIGSTLEQDLLNLR